MKNIADVMLYAFENSQNHSSDFNGNKIIPLNENWDKETFCFELGELQGSSSKIETLTKEKRNEYPASLLDDRLKLRAHSADYFDFSEAESVETFSPVSRGNILHQLFQLIEYKEDVSKAVSLLQFEGKLDQKQADEVMVFATDLLEDSIVAEWFSKDWTVVNERDILLGKDGVQRPDRVIYKGKEAIVIDFKFGKKKEKSHKKQVLTYKKLITKLGFENVKAFVLYGKLAEIEEV